MSVSKFFLMNEKAVRLSLNDLDSGIFTEPSGFGIAYNAKYLKVGDTWVPNSTELSQPTPSGKMIFAKKPYEAFQNFINFINKSSQLILIYQPAGLKTEYFAEIDIVSIQKGGFNANKPQFEVPVKFICKSLFHTSDKFEYQIQKAEKEIRWDFTWETKFNDASLVYFVFNNDGHVEAPFILSFIGYCLNPELTVTHNGVKVHSVKFNLEMQKEDRLTFSSFDDDLYIEVNGVNRMDCLNITNENFFKLPKGTSEVYFSSEAGRMNDITMSLEKYYKGV